MRAEQTSNSAGGGQAHGAAAPGAAAHEVIAHDVIDRLFVYGTLRAGELARAMMEEHVVDATPATARGRLYALPGRYPGLVEDDSAVVVGEVVTLTGLTAALALLDAYEGDEYVRKLTRVSVAGSGTTWAWCYVLRDPALVDGCEHIASGDWVAHTRST